MEIGLINGGEGDEHNALGLAVISDIFVIQDDVFMEHHNRMTFAVAIVRVRFTYLLRARTRPLQF